MSEITNTDGQKAAIESLEALLLPAAQMEIQYVHTFAPGVYVREAHVKGGMIGVGHEHKTKNINVVLKGRLKIVAGDEVIELVAPCVFVSEPGVRKVAHFLEDTIWLNVLHNPTNETDLKKLEDLFVIKSETYKAFQEAKEIKEESARAIAEGKL